MPAILGLLNPKEEEEIIGAACNSVEFAEEVAGIVSENEIWDEKNRILYMAVSFLANTIEPMHPKEIASTANKMAISSNKHYRYSEDEIKAMPHDVPTARGKIRILKNNAIYRELSMVNEWMMRELANPTNASQIINETIEKLTSIAPKKISSAVKLGEELSDLMEQALQARILAHLESKPVPYYPWASWNTILRPPSAGKAHIIGAPDNLGKSAWGREISMYWAKQGFEAVLMHNEDTRSEILLKILCFESRVELDVIKSGKYTDEQLFEIRSAQERMKEWLPRFHMIDATEMTSIDAVIELQAMVKKGKCQLVMIDYMGAFNATRGQAQSAGDWIQIVDDTRRFVKFSGKHEVPVITMAQGTKEMLEANVNMSRKLLAGGAKAYQAAQAIVLFTRDKLKEELRGRTGEIVARAGQYSPEVKVIVDKQNDGPAGFMTQYFEGQYYKTHDTKFY